jgi:hypothetical protein
MKTEIKKTKIIRKYHYQVLFGGFKILVYKMWEPRWLINLWVQKACYRDTSLFLFISTLQRYSVFHSVFLFQHFENNFGIIARLHFVSVGDPPR